MLEKISIDDFAKCDIRLGTILTADFVNGADKLIAFTVDLGEVRLDESGLQIKHIRQILSGIRGYYPDPTILVGQQVPVLCNLPTRKIRGLESEGMILYAAGEDLDFAALGPLRPVKNGTPIS